MAEENRILSTQEITDRLIEHTIEYQPPEKALTKTQIVNSYRYVEPAPISPYYTTQLVRNKHIVRHIQVFTFTSNLNSVSSDYNGKTVYATITSVDDWGYDIDWSITNQGVGTVVKESQTRIKITLPYNSSVDYPLSGTVVLTQASSGKTISITEYVEAKPRSWTLYLDSNVPTGLYINSNEMDVGGSDRVSGQNITSINLPGIANGGRAYWSADTPGDMIATTDTSGSLTSEIDRYVSVGFRDRNPGRLHVICNGPSGASVTSGRNSGTGSATSEEVSPWTYVSWYVSASGYDSESGSVRITDGDEWVYVTLQEHIDWVFYCSPSRVQVHEGEITEGSYRVISTRNGVDWPYELLPPLKPFNGLTINGHDKLWYTSGIQVAGAFSEVSYKQSDSGLTATFRLEAIKAVEYSFKWGTGDIDYVYNVGTSNAGGGYGNTVTVESFADGVKHGWTGPAESYSWVVFNHRVQFDLDECSVTWQENTSSASRTAVFTLTQNDSGKKITWTVTQVGKEEESNYVFNWYSDPFIDAILPAEEFSGVIVIDSTKDGSYQSFSTSSTPSWMKIKYISKFSETRGGAYFDVDTNSSSSSRSGTIEFIQDGSGKKVSKYLTQKAGDTTRDVAVNIKNDTGYPLYNVYVYLDDRDTQWGVTSYLGTTQRWTTPTKSLKVGQQIAIEVMAGKNSSSDTPIVREIYPSAYTITSGTGTLLIEVAITV